jgi:hypothetical protein
LSSWVRVWEHAFPKSCYRVSTSGVLLPDGTDPFGARCSGMGTVATVGLWQRHAVSCSLYELDDHVWLQLNERKFCLSNGSCDAQRTFVAPYVRRFSVWRSKSERPDVQYFYWFREFRDPWPDSGDFFEYVARSSLNQRAMAEFVCLWQSRARREGQVTPEEVAAIADCVEKRLRQSVQATREVPQDVSDKRV